MTRPCDVFPLLLSISIALMQCLCAAADVETLSSQDRAAVADAIDRARHGDALIFVFSPGLWHETCSQTGILAAHGKALRAQKIRVVWLAAFDAGGGATCQFPASVWNLDVRAMQIPGAVDRNDAGMSSIRSYFNADSEKFAVIVLGKDGAVKLRSSKPVPFVALIQALSSRAASPAEDQLAAAAR